MDKDLHFCIWGCGIRGKNIYRYMRGKGVRAFIDQNRTLQGTHYNGIPIISFQEYLERYIDCIVIATPFTKQWEVKCLLDKHHVNALSSVPLPSELFERYIPDLFDIVERKIAERGIVYLYGLNLYSLLLYEHYQEKGRPVKIIPEKGAPQWLLERIGQFRKDCIGQLEEVGTARLYVTSRELQEDMSLNADLVNIYDLMFDIKAYYNPKIEKFKGLHKGKRCFIIATGPSLRIEDLNTLYQNDEICISMNGIIKAYGETKWRPDYYLIEDRYCFLQWRDQLLGDGRVENMLVADLCHSTDTEQNFIEYHMSLQRVIKSEPTGFSTDFAQGAYEGMTVTYGCLQFAAYLGCTEIYLYGLDHNWEGQYNHFTKNYYTLELEHEAADEVWTKELIENSYRSALLAGEKLGIKIYNASRATKLEVFDRVDFDSLFTKKSAGLGKK